MKFTFEVFLTLSSASWIAASVSNYMDLIRQQFPEPSRSENPCNPLFWFPRSMPDYCYKSQQPALPPPPFPPLPPMPYPAPPVPAYPPMMYSAVQQYAPPPPPMLPLTAQMPFRTPGFGMPSPSFGMPSPSFGMPPAQPYYPPALPPQLQAGLVPGLPGIVSPDGGINILPFSDAYTDMLEKHKQKLIRKRLQKVLDEYENYPHKKQKHRNY